MKKEKIGYSSVKGSLHEKDNLPNQDAYSVKRYNFGTILVLSDGLGSKAYSDIGSKAACKAVNRAVQIWNEYSKRDARQLLPLICSIWNIEIFPYSGKECAATCLFAIILDNGMLYIGQLGDGDIYISLDNVIDIVHEKEDDFSNMTDSLGGFSSFNDWTLKQYDIKDRNIRIAMMSDGVSETIIDGKQYKFVSLLWQRVSMLNNLNKRNNFIFRLLADWNTVNAGDDRTLISYEKNRWCKNG